MKNVLLGSIAATITLALPAFAENAYDAMRVVGKQKGEAVLEKITEVRGLHGVPEPGSWKISTKETAYDVRSGKITATSTGHALPTLNLSELKLDSDGAHTVAEREARKVAFAYDYVDYTLRSGSKATPVWEVRLVDETKNRIAVLNIGADTGKVISSEGLKKGATTTAKTPVASRPPEETEHDRPSDGPPPTTTRPQKTPPATPPKYVEQDPADYDPADEPTPKKVERPRPTPRYSRDDRDEDDSLDDSHFEQGYQKVVDRVGKHLNLRANQLKSWFDRNVKPGGRPTYGSSRESRYDRDDSYERREPAPKPRQDPNETRYYRPAPGERPRD